MDSISLPGFIRAACCWLALLLAAPVIGAAPPAKLVGGDVAPYSWVDQGRATGPASDLVREMANRLGYGHADIAIYPWARTILLGEKHPDTLIFPLSRIAEREDKYTWIVELLQDQYVLITRADSKLDISSLAAMPTARVGYLRGSPGRQLLAETGHLRLAEEVGHESLNAKKLRAGHIDAWIANRQLAQQAWTGTGGRPDELQFGQAVLELRMYLAASRHFAPEEAERWRKAFQDMRRDGTCALILSRYGGAVCPPR